MTTPPILFHDLGDEGTTWFIEGTLNPDTAFSVLIQALHAQLDVETFGETVDFILTTAAFYPHDHWYDNEDEPFRVGIVDRPERRNMSGTLIATRDVINGLHAQFSDATSPTANDPFPLAAAPLTLDRNSVAS